VTFYSCNWVKMSTPPYDNSILFAGYYRDEETGLYHVRNRTYHPALGRWMQRDPADYADGMSLYEYVGSRPANRTDPQGLSSEWKCCLKIDGWLWKDFHYLTVRMHRACPPDYFDSYPKSCANDPKGDGDNLVKTWQANPVPGNTICAWYTKHPAKTPEDCCHLKTGPIPKVKGIYNIGETVAGLFLAEGGLSTMALSATKWKAVTWSAYAFGTGAASVAVGTFIIFKGYIDYRNVMYKNKPVISSDYVEQGHKCCIDSL